MLLLEELAEVRPFDLVKDRGEMLRGLSGPFAGLVRLLGELLAAQMLLRALGDLELDVVPGVGQCLAVLLVLALEIAGPLEEVLLAQPPVLRHRGEQELELRIRLIHMHRVARYVLLPELPGGPVELRADVLLCFGVQTVLAPVRVVLGEPLRIELQDHTTHGHGVGLDLLLNRRQARVQVVRQLGRRRPVVPLLVLRHDRGTPAAVAVVDHRDVHRCAHRIDVRVPLRKGEPGGLISIAGDVANEVRRMSARRLDLVARVEGGRVAHRAPPDDPTPAAARRASEPPAALPWGLPLRRSSPLHIWDPAP